MSDKAKITELKTEEASQIRLRASVDAKPTPPKSSGNGDERSPIADDSAAPLNQDASAVPENPKPSSDEEQTIKAARQVPTAPQQQPTPNFAVKQSSGLLRHRLIVGLCLCMSVGILGLTAFDLNSLMTVDGTLDKSLKFHRDAAQPMLPPNLSYEHGSDVVFNDGLAPVYQMDRSHGRLIGFVNERGEVVIKPQFDSASDFKNGLATVYAVTKNGRDNYHNTRGMIDRTGKVVVPLTFDTIEPFTGNAAFASRPHQRGLIDKTGRFLYTLKSTHDKIDVAGKHFRVTEGGQEGLMNDKGEWLIKPAYEHIYTIADLPDRRDLLPEVDRSRAGQYYKLGRDGLYGLADPNGKVLFEPKFDDIDSVNKGMVAVRKKTVLGFADLAGNIKIEPQFSEVSQFDDLITVRKDRKWLLMNGQGQILPAPTIDAAPLDTSREWLSEGLGVVIKDNKYGFVDAQGKIAIQPQFEYAMPFRNGHAFVWDGTFWRLIDRQGRFANGLTIASVKSISPDVTKIELAGPFFPLTKHERIVSLKSAIERMRDDTTQKTGPY